MIIIFYTFFINNKQVIYPFKTIHSFYCIVWDFSHSSTWDIKPLCLGHNLSYSDILMYGLAHFISDTFFCHICQHWSEFLILFLFFPGMAVMLFFRPTNSMQNQARISTCIYCGSFQIHQPIVVYHSVDIYHDTLLGFVFWNVSKCFFTCFFPLSDCCKIFFVSKDVSLNIYKLSTNSYE